jgi:hypothetical protein
MTTGPHEPGKLHGMDAEEADEAAAEQDEGIVERENELAPGGHDDRQVNPHDREDRGTAGDPDARDPEAGQP